MDYRLELVAVPVSDVDRAKSFYVEKAGFHPDHDHTVSEEMRFVQLTPPGSACSIATAAGPSAARPRGSGRAARGRDQASAGSASTRPPRIVSRSAAVSG